MHILARIRANRFLSTRSQHIHLKRSSQPASEQKTCLDTSQILWFTLKIAGPISSNPTGTFERRPLSRSCGFGDQQCPPTGSAHELKSVHKTYEQRSSVCKAVVEHKTQVSFDQSTTPISHPAASQVSPKTNKRCYSTSIHLKPSSRRREFQSEKYFLCAKKYRRVCENKSGACVLELKRQSVHLVVNHR